MARFNATSSASAFGYGGKGGKGLGKTHKRHRKVVKDTIQGVTGGDICRLARRGGVKRISGGIYEDLRFVLRKRLETILEQISVVLDGCGRKTVSVMDVIFVLNRLGTPIYVRLKVTLPSLDQSSFYNVSGACRQHIVHPHWIPPLFEIGLQKQK